MIVPETKSIYIQSRHELGREWECFGCDDPATPPSAVTWAPVEPREEHDEYVIYDSKERGTEGGTMMGIYFEDTFPQADDFYGENDYSYYNEANVYKRSTVMGTRGTGALSAIPIEVVQIFKDHESAGAKELSLGVLEIGINQGRTYFDGLGGRGYPVNVQVGDRIVLRPLWLDEADLVGQNPEAVRAGHDSLSVTPIRGNFPIETCDDWVPEVPSSPGAWYCEEAGWWTIGCGLISVEWFCKLNGCDWVQGPPTAAQPGYCRNDQWSLRNYEGWEKRFFLNVTIDMVETKMVNKIIE